MLIIMVKRESPHKANLHLAFITKKLVQSVNTDAQLYYIKLSISITAAMVSIGADMVVQVCGGGSHSKLGRLTLML